jgi:hypothetical protein
VDAEQVILEEQALRGFAMIAALDHSGWSGRTSRPGRAIEAPGEVDAVAAGRVSGAAETSTLTPFHSSPAC